MRETETIPARSKVSKYKEMLRTAIPVSCSNFGSNEPMILACGRRHAIGVVTVFVLFGMAVARGQEGLAQHPAPEQAPSAPKIAISKETTWAMEPLRPDGGVDYFEVINRHFGAEVTADENAAVLLYQALGPRPDGGRRMPDALFRRMGMEPPPDEGEYFQKLGNWLQRQPNPPDDIQLLLDQQALAGTRPWTRAEFPLIAAWLDDNAGPLQVIVAAMQRPCYFLPMATDQDGALMEILLPGVQASREVARALKARAMRELGEGSQLVAWHNLITLHQLGRHVGHGATLIEHLVGVAIESMAIDGELVFLAETRQSTRMLARYRQQLERLPSRAPVVDKLDVSERAMTLDAVHRLARGTIDLQQFGRNWGGNGILNMLAGEWARNALDWNVILKSMNSWYDRIVEVCRRPTFSERAAGVRQLDQELMNLRAQRQSPVAFLAVLGGQPAISQMVADELVLMLLPAVNAVQTAEGRVLQRMSNVEIAFALALWRSEHNDFPQSWDALVPQYLPATPIDLFNGQPLRYTRLPDGCRFYSVGSNGQDDEGRTFGENRPGDDLPVHMKLSRTP